MRLIDGKKLQQEYVEANGKRLLLIDLAPTVDAVPVVRCNDCIHRRVKAHYGGRWSCDMHGGWYPLDYYCADGERRKNNDLYETGTCKRPGEPPEAL